jgi:hypothetical protein
VIHDVDEALRRLVREVALRGNDVDVVFDAPTKDWAARRNAPTVNLYLYDLREDLRRRQRGLLNEYDPRGQVVARHPAPRHVKLSYLLTAWTQRAEDEHRLLSALLMTFMRYEAVPRAMLSGDLAALGLPVPLTVALPPPEDRSFADVWTALGGELKPSLDIVVSAPLVTADVRVAAPPPLRGIVVDMGAQSEGPATGERVAHTAEGEPLPRDGKPMRVTMRRRRRPPA